jgi:hypothetical protein
MDDTQVGGETAGAGAAEAAQGAATEAAGTSGSQTQGGGAAPQGWRVGDTTFPDVNSLHQGALRWQGDFTRVSQQNAAMTKEMGGLKAVFNIVTQDPRLRQEVLARIGQGQSPQQAAQQTAQAHPELMNRVNGYENRIAAMEKYQSELQQDIAQNMFKDSHPDLKPEEWTAMAQYLGENAEYFGNSISPLKLIEIAYNNAVLPRRIQTMQASGVQQSQEEAVKRATKPLMGSQAATAGARAQSLERPKVKDGKRPTAAEERAYAQRVFERSKGAR